MKRNARIAGILYILLGVTAPVRLIYIPNAVLVSGNAQATAANIASHEIFRVAILTDMLAGLLSLFVAIALFRLFREVDRDLALLMLVLGGVMVSAIYFFNLVNDAAALVVARAPTYLAAFDQRQRDGLTDLMYPAQLAEIVVMLWLAFGRLSADSLIAADH